VLSLYERDISGGQVLSDIDTVATAAPAGETPPAAPAVSKEAILDLVLHSLDDDKAEEIVQIDLRGRSAFADHMVVCSGRSSRQVAAISEKLLDRLKEAFRISARIEGKETGDWVLIDAGDVVVHVFRPEVREFYQLEKLWQTPPEAFAAKPRAVTAGEGGAP
jgi:ribosome-associated protein